MCLTTIAFLSWSAIAVDPCVSGLTTGQRPGPYSSVVAVGSQRGTSHCFICETEDRPAVIIFARRPTEALGKLLRGLDKALDEKKEVELRAWATFLSDDQPALDPVLVKWSREQAIQRVPLGVFEDLVGPPSYRLNREAEVTVLLAVKRKVVGNYAFRANELSDERIAEILRAVSKLTTKVEPKK